MPHSKLETGKNGKHLWILHHKERGELLVLHSQRKYYLCRYKY